jgi:hypothetical protein
MALVCIHADPYQSHTYCSFTSRISTSDTDEMQNFGFNNRVFSYNDVSNIVIAPKNKEPFSFNEDTLR